jgi:hypothetical protein
VRRRLGAGLALAAWLSGCSWLGPWKQGIVVSSEPPGATVLINGEVVGKTPLRTKISRAKGFLLEIQLEGYETDYPPTHRTMSALGIVDTLAGSIVYVPWLGLLSPGAWKYEPEVFGVTLSPKKPEAATAQGTAP